MVENSRATEYEKSLSSKLTSDVESICEDITEDNYGINKGSIISLRIQLLSNSQIL